MDIGNYSSPNFKVDSGCGLQRGMGISSKWNNVITENIIPFCRSSIEVNLGI